MRPVQYATTIDYNLVQFPLMMWPKPNGVFGTFYRDAMYTREGNRISNAYIQDSFADVATVLEGLEFEIDFPDSDFNRLSGVVRSADQIAGLDVVLKCFDFYIPNRPAIGRQGTVKRLVATADRGDIVQIPWVIVKNYEELAAQLAIYKKMGYEGAVYRAPNSFYKGNGRSTMREACFLRDKFEQDVGGYIVNIHESIDKHGVPKGMAHAVTVCVPENNNAITRVTMSRGLTDADRRAIWEHRLMFMGKWLDFTTNGFDGMDYRHSIFQNWRTDKDAGYKI